MASQGLILSYCHPDGSVNKKAILHCPRPVLVGVCTLCLESGNYCTGFQLSRQGNSCQLLECSCENKQRLGSSLHLAAFPLLTSPFQPSPLESFRHLTVSAEPAGEINQQNISSRLEALDPGPESAIFQLLGKNMCSGNSYKIPSKAAAALANHMSSLAALKDFLCLGLLGSRRVDNVASFKSERHPGCVHVLTPMLIFKT